MPKPGDIVLAWVQFSDTAERKKRPALVLSEEFGNVVVAGITSNTAMKGIAVGPKDGLFKESVIKLNYIFTITAQAIEKKLCTLPPAKRREAHEALAQKLARLNSP
ncbi:MAG: type II toxin-antitoxin system PemK/MazF family toxin [Candidatus Micrarchaeota archaeon]